MMCLKRAEKKQLLGRYKKVVKCLFNYFKKNTETATGGALQKSCSEKLRDIRRTKVAKGKCYVKKVFLVVDRAVKLTCSYID